MNRCLTLIFLALTLSSSCFAQLAAKTDVANPELFFNANINHQSRLANGIAFEEYYYNVIGSANFQELTAFSIGSIIYDGIRFDSIPLMYNLHQDKLLLPLTEFTKYSLISQKVSDFYINNHHFKYIHVVDTTTTNVRSGFFDILYSGKQKMLAKRTKSMYQKIENQRDMFFRFSSKTVYYLERDNKYYPVSSQASLLNYFKDKKKELKSYIKTNKIKFRKDPEQAMSLLVRQYETLVY